LIFKISPVNAYLRNVHDQFKPSKDTDKMIGFNAIEQNIMTKGVFIKNKKNSSAAE